jgi:CheY-like chemotaxis protein
MHHTQKLESLGVLAGGIAHDFNNILAAITGRCDLGRIQLADDSVACKYFAEIQHAAERAAELCRSLLAYAGRNQIELKPVNVDVLINETLPLLKLPISYKTNLIYRTDNERLSVTGDRSQLRQVLLNLVLNASESLKDQTGTIQICVREKQFNNDAQVRFYSGQSIAAGRYVLLEISDTGTGMEPDTVKRIFEPFYTTKFAGRGLGLAAVLGIIRGHGGGIQIVSTPGEGSCFSIYLPAARDNDAIEKTFEEQPVIGWGKGLILVAEDNPQVQKVTKGMVEALGFKALCASDGMRAVELFEKNADTIRAAVLDMAMPVMDGREVFLNIRARQGSLPVLFVSGFDAANVQNELKGEKHVAFLQKPFCLEVFSMCLKELVTK